MHYLVVDFECLRPREWQSVGLVLYDGNAGETKFSVELSCARDTANMSPHICTFWERHPVAFKQNIDRGYGYDPLDQEKILCEYIDVIRNKYDNFTLISDAPEHDISILDGILLRHGRDVMSMRKGGVYRQVVCTWTTRRVLRGLGLSTGNNQPTEVAVRHTPVADCLIILSNYLSCLLTIREARLPKNGRYY